jgi:hypothetical protein
MANDPGEIALLVQSWPKAAMTYSGRPHDMWFFGIILSIEGHRKRDVSGRSDGSEGARS